MYAILNIGLKLPKAYIYDFCNKYSKLYSALDPEGIPDQKLTMSSACMSISAPAAHKEHDKQA